MFTVILIELRWIYFYIFTLLFQGNSPKNNSASRQIELTPEELSLSNERHSPGVVLFSFQRQPSFAGAEDVGQIFSDINAVRLCRVDNRIGSSTGVGSFRRGGKQPVFLPMTKGFTALSAKLLSIGICVSSRKA